MRERAGAVESARNQQVRGFEAALREVGPQWDPVKQRWVLPVLGGLIAGDVAAYRYLNRTVELFARTDLEAMLQNAGFTAAKRIPLTFGVATIYIGRKASH